LRHVKEFHSNIETFLCTICKLCFPTLKLKQEHNQKVHSGNFVCIYCSNWSCTYLSNLRRHLKQKHQGEFIQCRYNNKCGLYFKNQIDLQKHISESHEKDKSEKLLCIYCSKFIPCASISSHINVHHKSVAIRCTFNKTCRTYFATKEDKEMHVLNVHYTGKVVEKMKCTHCNKVYLNFNDLKNHVQNIHGKSLLKCREKNCSFISSSSVNHHKHLLEQHAETKKIQAFRCSKCNYNSKFFYSLKSHNLRMHGTENLKCSMCSENNYFRSAIALNSHLKKVHHKKSKKIMCIHCDHSVLNLYSHVIQRPCILCNKIFSCRGLMQKHRSKCKPRN
jgi:hypothetical protein